MEDRLSLVFDGIRREGSPDSATERLNMLLGGNRSQDLFGPVYSHSRAEGLTISEAELSARIYEALISEGPEALLA